MSAMNNTSIGLRRLNEQAEVLHSISQGKCPTGSIEMVNKAKVVNAGTCKKLRAPSEDVDADLDTKEKPLLGPATRLHRKDKGVTRVDNIIKKVQKINEDVIQKNDKFVKMLQFCSLEILYCSWLLFYGAALPWFLWVGSHLFFCWVLEG